MRKSYLFFLLLFTAFISCKNEKDKKSEVSQVNDSKPVTEVKSSFEDLEGNAVELADYQGKRILLNYWATWCKPCIEEMPALLNAQEVLEDENYIFLLASDQSIEKIEAFKEKKKFNFTFLKFNGSLADMQISALPATFIYNESGKFVNRINGATEWDSPKILEKLKAIK